MRAQPHPHPRAVALGICVTAQAAGRVRWWDRHARCRAFNHPQSAVRSPQSAVRSPQSAVRNRNLQPATRNLQPATRNPQPATRNRKPQPQAATASRWDVACDPSGSLPRVAGCSASAVGAPRRALSRMRASTRRDRARVVHARASAQAGFRPG